jgi:hypothetical protein
MPGHFIDETAPSLHGDPPKLPSELPHGLLTLPERVRELVAGEKAKHSPAIFTAAEEERVLNDWTLQNYFNSLGYEVLYRQTPAGPEVLAVDFDEIAALTDGMRAEKMAGLKTWMP